MYNLTPSISRISLCILLCLASSSLFAQKMPKHNDVVALSKNADENASILNDYLDALVAGNLNRARSLLAADYQEHGPGYENPMNAGQAIDSWQTSLNQRTDHRITDRRTLAYREKSGLNEGDWVMGWGVYHWQEKAGGTMIELPYQITARVQDGKLKEARYYYDRAIVRDKMGYAAIPPDVDPDAYMIRKVLEAETQAWLDNDGQKMVSYWADLPYAAHTVTDESGKAYDITATEIGEMVTRLSTQQPNKPGTTFTTTNFNIRPNGDAAWANYEQTFHYPDGREPVTNIESRFLEKIDGQWKISHMISIPKR